MWFVALLKTVGPAQNVHIRVVCSQIHYLLAQHCHTCSNNSKPLGDENEHIFTAQHSTTSWYTFADATSRFSQQAWLLSQFSITQDNHVELKLVKGENSSHRNDWNQVTAVPTSGSTKPNNSFRLVHLAGLPS